MARHQASLVLVLALLAGVALGLSPASAPADGERCAEALWERAEDVELPPVDGETEDQAPSKIVYSNNGTVEFGEGTMIGYARLTGPCDPPAAIGVELSASIQEGLPKGKMVLHYLPFFEDEAPDWNPFSVAEVDWAPMGHEPPGMYTVPHWDFHFYLTPKEEIDTIVPGSCMGLSTDAFEAANQPLYAQCFPGGDAPPPPSYANLGAVAPFMGNHYVNTQSPEFAALMSGGNAEEAWNETWIWGGFDGKISFFEVMAKRDWLAESPSLCAPIPNMPSEFSIAGYKPSTYCVISDGETTKIELRDFKWYDAACTSGDYAPASYLSLPPGSPPLEAECVVPKLEGTGGPGAGGPTAAPAPEPAPSAASHATAGALAALAAAAVALLAL